MVSNINKNKKAMTLNNEIILYLVAIAIISIVLFMTNNAMVVAKKNSEDMAPELTYQYPVIFVKSFLMLEVSDVDKKDLGLDLSKSYYVKDLIYKGDTDSKDIVNSMKNAYIQKMNSESSLKSFENFVKVDLVNNDLLDIAYEANSIPDLKYILSTGNYVFYFQGEDKKFRRIYFLSPTSNIDLKKLDSSTGVHISDPSLIE